uniref:Protein kinase domain-containing protein n=1 Tax=Syphacia muris TaxID=451379 RepID=A0A0N5AIB2_9BILA
MPFLNSMLILYFRDSLSSCIGKGSFGVVYRGVETTTGKAVAIKKLPKSQLKGNELKVMKAVTSKYLVALIDICTDNTDYMYIIMELCDIDLEQHLRYRTEKGYLPENDLKILIDNVTRGYYALYECNIVHRDLKPQNILVTYDPVSHGFKSAKITDFGISRILTEEQNQALSNIAGTFFYMAPEVGANILTTTEYNYEVDMWSLGCVFYQCITGQVPFDECRLCRIFLFTASGNYDAYDKPDIPDDLEEEVRFLVDSLLEIDSSKRITPKKLIIICSCQDYYYYYYCYGY